MKSFLQGRVSLSGLLHAAGLLAGLGTVTAFLAEWSWVLELTAHFRLQYALALVALAGVSLWSARPSRSEAPIARPTRTAALVYGTLALANLAVLSPYLAVRPSATRSDALSFRVVTLNVHTGNARHDLVESFLRAAAPDAIVLTEVDDRWLRQLAVLTNAWPHTLQAPRDDNFGIALFSRWPLAHARVAYFGSAGLPSVEAELRLGDRRVRLLGTHPPPPSGAVNAAFRDEQLAAVASRLSLINGAKVLVGDFNATPWSPVFRRLVAASGLVDTLRGRGYQATWPSRAFPFWIPLDHCLVSPDITILDRRVGPHVGSDHRPVIVDLRFPAHDRAAQGPGGR